MTAQGIVARRATTLGVVHESPVRAADAPERPQHRWESCLCGYQQPRTTDPKPSYCRECRELTMGEFDR